MVLLFLHYIGVIMLIKVLLHNLSFLNATFDSAYPQLTKGVMLVWKT